MMSAFLCITVRFLQPYAHCRGDQGQPEWPPSPLRLFQAMVNAAAGCWNERRQVAHAGPILEWLERQGPPTIVAPTGTPSGTRFRLYVPDNVADLIARKWQRGNTAVTIADYRTEKDVWPIHLAHDAVHYLYPLAERNADFQQHLQTIVTTARSITHLGWGMDMVVGNAAVLSDEDAAKLSGERWEPSADGPGVCLRMPVSGTLDALATRHTAFLNRLSASGFSPVPPLTRFNAVVYRRQYDPSFRPMVAFSILKPDASGYRAFSTARGCRDVAAWARHAVAQVCQGWPFDRGETAGFVHGHAPDGAPLRNGPRFQYLPLPTIETRGALGQHVGAIRRVLVAAPPGFRERIDWIRRRLPNTDLVRDDGSTVALLNLLPMSDWVLQRYVAPATTWTTVTPVVLPGHDDHDPRKAESLLWKAFLHAGISEHVLKQMVLEFRKVGFLPGVDLADRHALPERPSVKGPRYHVRVAFPRDFPGPIAVGALRYRGFGLFVRMP